MLDWYVVVAKQNQDGLAAKGLREQGYPDVYLPKTYERVLTPRGHKAVAQLLLSPYLFVFMDVALGHAGPVRNTRGVGHILCEPDGRPIPLHDGEQVIWSLRRTEDEEMFNISASTKKGREDLKRGMPVRIDSHTLLTRSATGQAVPIEGRILKLERGKAWVLCGTMTWTVDEVDLSEIAA